jgi:hypothetical protein
MKDNTILIEDTRGHAFFLEIWTPSTATNLKFWHCDRSRYQGGDWEAMDKGYIRFSSGDAFLADPKSPVLEGYCYSGAGAATFKDLFLGEPGAVDGHDNQLFEWGMVLHDYSDGYGGVKDNGWGEVKQKWVLSLDPGQFTWKKATMADAVRVGASRAQQGAAH